jgi:hypothetical protein
MNVPSVQLAEHGDQVGRVDSGSLTWQWDLGKLLQLERLVAHLDGKQLRQAPHDKLQELLAGAQRLWNPGGPSNFG